jgi:hypothetical protein
MNLEQRPAQPELSRMMYRFVKKFHLVLPFRSDTFLNAGRQRRKCAACHLTKWFKVPYRSLHRLNRFA